MSSSDFSEVDIEEFDDLVASPPSSPRSRGTLDLSNHHPVDMAPVLTPSLPKLTTSSDEKVKEPYVRSTVSERSSSAFPPDLLATYKKHERFYFDDGNITFLVEDVLYNVHRYFFCRDSPYFVNLISNRCGDPSIFFSQPFVLKDIEVEDFDALLRILYPLNFDECEVKTVAEWTSVLRLATQWSLTSIRKLAISHLGHIASAFDKIVLGRTYSVDPWLVPGFVAICQRPQPLTRDEGRRLGVDDAVLVACLRESVYTCLTKPKANEITTTVRACLMSPDIADKGAIRFIVSEASSIEGLHAAIPSDSGPSGSSHSKPSSTPKPSTPPAQYEADSASAAPTAKAATPAVTSAKGTLRTSKTATRAASKAVSKIGTPKGTATQKPEGLVSSPYVPPEAPPAPAEAPSPAAEPVAPTADAVPTSSEAPAPAAPEISASTEADSAPSQETREATPPGGMLDAPATGESLTSSFSGLLGTAGKVASGWGGWGGGAKAPAAAPSAAGGWGSPAKTPGWGSTGSSATKGATGWGSQSKTPAAAGGWGSAGTAAGWGSTGAAEENKDTDSWNLLDKSEANENNNTGPNKGWGSGGWGGGGWGGGNGAGSDQNKSSGDLLELDTVQTNHAEIAPVTTEAAAEALPDATPEDGDAAPDASAEGETGAAEVAIIGEDAKGKTKEHLKLDTATGASAGPTTGTGASQLPSAVDTPAEEEAGGGDDDAKEEERESKDNKQGAKGKKGKAKKGKGKK